MAYGFVYVLVNDSLPYLKIGKTYRSPAQRAVELSSTGVPTPFVVAYSRYVENCDLLETEIHRRLSEKRVNANREFFAEDLSVVVELIESLVSPSLPTEALPPGWDPVSYIAMLGQERGDVIQSTIDDVDYYRGIALECRQHLIDILESVNGRINANGLEVFFEAADDCGDIRINIQSCLPELPKCAIVPGIMLEHDPVYHVFNWSPDSPKVISIENYDADNEVEIQDGDFLDVRVFAKKILDSIEWPTQIEGIQRQDMSVDISELLEKAWLLYEKDNPMRASKNNRTQEFYDELYFWTYVPDVVEELATLHSLPSITVSAWKEMTNRYDDGLGLLDRLNEVPTGATHELSEWFRQQWRP